MQTRFDKTLQIGANRQLIRQMQAFPKNPPDIESPRAEFPVENYRHWRDEVLLEIQQRVRDSYLRIEPELCLLRQAAQDEQVPD